MRLRLFGLAAMVVAIAAPAMAPAAENKADAPAVLVRVQSVNDLLKTVDYIASLLPEDAQEQVKQGVGFVKSLIDDKKGIEGIDVKLPIGLYASLSAEAPAASPIVGLIPVADKQTVLDALKTRAMLEVKEKDGLYETTPPNSPPLFFRFANGYAYITNEPEHIDPKTLPKPETILGGKAEHLISATIRVDRLPEQMKKMALGFVENAIAQGKDQPIPNETPAIKAFKNQAIDDVVKAIQSVLMDGEALSLRLNVDPKTEEFALELEMNGKKGSKLAKDFASIRENKSVVGGALASGDAAMTLNVSLSLAESLKKLFGPVVDDLIEMAKKEGNVPGEIQTKAEPLIKALTPSLKAGELDAGISLLGPDKEDHYTAVIGLKLTGGKKVEDAIRELVKKELPPEFSGFFALDAEDLSGGSKLHIIRVNNVLDDKMKKVLGKNDAYLSFRDDLLVLAIGPQGKEAVTKAIASKPADVGVMKLDVSMSRIAPLAAEAEGQAAAAKAAAKKIFAGKPATNDKLSVSILGGESMKVRIALQGKAIKFLAESGMGKNDN